MEAFWTGFEKAASAEERPDQHHMRRAFLGNSISSAIEAKKGKKLEAFGKAYKHDLKQRLKGFAAGGAGGAAVGALGALATRGKVHPAVGAAVGGYGGAAVGTSLGMFRGTHDAEASRIHGEHSKNK